MALTHPKTLYGAILVLASVGIGTAAFVAAEREEREASMPEGTMLVVALDGTLSTATARVGDPVTLHTVHAIHSRTGAVVPAGATIRGSISRIERDGAPAGGAAVTLSLATLEQDGRTLAIAALPFRVRATTARASADRADLVMDGLPGAPVLPARSVAVSPAIGDGAVLAALEGELVLPAGKPLRVYLAAPLTLRQSPARQDDERDDHDDDRDEEES
jgi:hypothetical protein